MHNKVDITEDYSHFAFFTKWTDNNNNRMLPEVKRSFIRYYLSKIFEMAINSVSELNLQRCYFVMESFRMDLLQKNKFFREINGME